MYDEIDQGNFTSVSMLMDWNTVSNTNNNGTKSGWNTCHSLNQMKQNLMEKFVMVQMDKDITAQLVSIFSSLVIVVNGRDLEGIGSENPVVEYGFGGIDFIVVFSAESNYEVGF